MTDMSNGDLIARFLTPRLDEAEASGWPPAIIKALRLLAEDHSGWCCVKETCCGEIGDMFNSYDDPCPSLRIMLALWDDHPDYRQEWALEPTATP